MKILLQIPKACQHLGDAGTDVHLPVSAIHITPKISRLDSAERSYKYASQLLLMDCLTICPIRVALTLYLSTFHTTERYCKSFTKHKLLRLHV